MNLSQRQCSTCNVHFVKLIDLCVALSLGPYLIGQKLGHSPVDSIVQYLAKKENSNEFVQLKVCLIGLLADNVRNGWKKYSWFFCIIYRS